MQPYMRMLLALAVSLGVAAGALGARVVMWAPRGRLHGWLLWMQAMAAGLLLGDGLLHMLPEALDHGVSAGQAGYALAIGVLGLVLMESIVRAMAGQPSVATYARMDIVGDVFHHLVDGVVIGAGFVVDPLLGAMVSLAILAHELPREMSHAGVLVAGGYTPQHAFRLSLMTTSVIPLGVLGVMLLEHSPQMIGISLALAAGSTVYVACSDLIPALWQSIDARNRFTPAIGITGGMVFMWLVAVFGPVH